MEKIVEEIFKEDIKEKLEKDYTQLYIYDKMLEMIKNDPEMFAPSKITKRIEQKFEDAFKNNKYGIVCHYDVKKWSKDDIDYRMNFWYGDNESETIKLKTWWFDDVQQDDIERLPAWRQYKQKEIDNKEDLIKNAKEYVDEYNDIVDRLEKLYGKNELLKYLMTLK